ncbi:unnamed protein product [Linum tenue]|uniref:Uncharacterized protein n=1 Tax=Linum tenue TaxID=586396 RepID=A0AAV0RT79_9ROSI|nr:unnamed protein product [Linum tenue]
MASPASRNQKSRKSKSKHSLKELKALGQQLLSSRSNVINLPILLNFISPEFPSQYVFESILSLQSSSLVVGINLGRLLFDDDQQRRTRIRLDLDLPSRRLLFGDDQDSFGSR